MYTLTTKANVEAETIFSKCFIDGTLFYSTRICNTVFYGFLRPEDSFDIALACTPKFWRGGSFGDMEYWNIACDVKSTEEHERLHHEYVLRILNKDSNFCPGRLRKLRKFDFFDE